MGKPKGVRKGRAPGTPLPESQKRLKRAERFALRDLQDVYKDIDRGVAPSSPLKRDALGGLRRAAWLRARHSYRYYGELDSGHARWVGLLEEACRETERFLGAAPGEVLTFRATTVILSGYSAPASPAKIPRARFSRY